MYDFLLEDSFIFQVSIYLNNSEKLFIKLFKSFAISANLASAFVIESKLEINGTTDEAFGFDDFVINDGIFDRSPFELQDNIKQKQANVKKKWKKL